MNLLELKQKYRDAVDQVAKDYDSQLYTRNSHIDQYFAGPGVVQEDYALHRDCNVCGSDRTEPILEDSPFPFVRCLDCGFGYMNPIVDPERTEILTEGIAEMRQYAIEHMAKRGRTAKPNQQLREILKVKNEGAFLDVGCGLGRQLEMASRFFERSEGIEVCRTTAAYCRQAGYTVHDRPLEELDLPDASFDVVFMGQVIEHLVDPRRNCERVFELLKSGGVFYLDTPNFFSLSMRLFGARNSLVFGSSHISLFNRATLCRLLESVGFRIHRARTYQTDLYPMDVLYYMINRERFRHRRNLHLPFYLLFYRVFHQVFEEQVCRNMGPQWGSYMRVLAVKP